MDVPDMHRIWFLPVLRFGRPAIWSAFSPEVSSTEIVSGMICLSLSTVFVIYCHDGYRPLFDILIIGIESHCDFFQTMHLTAFLCNSVLTFMALSSRQISSVQESSGLTRIMAVTT